MSGEQTQIKKPYPGPTWLAVLPPWLLFTALGFAFLGLPAAFINMLVPGNYLPSLPWLEAARPAVYALWSICGCAYFLCGLIASKKSGANAYIDAVFVTMIALGFFFIPLSNMVYSGLPSLVATVAGSEVQHQFRVSANNLAGYKWCRSPLDLEAMPFMTALCDAKEFRPRLAPGISVTFGGKGTWMGLYVEYIDP